MKKKSRRYPFNPKRPTFNNRLKYQWGDLPIGFHDARRFVVTYSDEDGRQISGFHRKSDALGLAASITKRHNFGELISPARAYDCKKHMRIA